MPGIAKFAGCWHRAEMSRSLVRLILLLPDSTVLILQLWPGTCGICCPRGEPVRRGTKQGSHLLILSDTLLPFLRLRLTCSAVMPRPSSSEAQQTTRNNRQAQHINRQAGKAAGKQVRVWSWVCPDDLDECCLSLLLE